MPFHILPYHWCQLLSLFAAIYCYRGLRKFSLTLFIPLLAITSLIDLLGSNWGFSAWNHAYYRVYQIYLVSVPGVKKNYFIYNMYLLLSPLFYLTLFYYMLRLSHKAKKGYLAIATICLVLIFSNYVFLQGTNVFNSYSFLFIEIINIACCSIILFRLALIEESSDEHIYHHPYFWISLSLLLFSLGAVAVLGLQAYIANHKIEIGGKNIYRIVMPNLNIILYLGYTYAFILCRKKNNSSLS